MTQVALTLDERRKGLHCRIGGQPESTTEDGATDVISTYALQYIAHVAISSVTLTPAAISLLSYSFNRASTCPLESA